LRESSNFTETAPWHCNKSVMQSFTTSLSRSNLKNIIGSVDGHQVQQSRFETYIWKSDNYNLKESFTWKQLGGGHGRRVPPLFQTVVI